MKMWHECWMKLVKSKGTEGVLLTFDDFIQGVEDFGQKSSHS